MDQLYKLTLCIGRREILPMFYYNVWFYNLEGDLSPPQSSGQFWKKIRNNEQCSSPLVFRFVLVVVKLLIWRQISCVILMQPWLWFALSFVRLLYNQCLRVQYDLFCSSFSFPSFARARRKWQSKINLIALGDTRHTYMELFHEGCRATFLKHFTRNVSQTFLQSFSVLLYER